MKKLLSIVFFAGLTSVAQAQNIASSQVPSVVLNTFQSTFPNATDIEWEVKGELYKVEFEIGTRDHDVWIDKAGKIKKHKEDIAKTTLPDPILQKIKSSFGGYRIDDADRIEAEGKIFFLVELDGQNDDDDRDLIFTADGAIQTGINP